MFIGLYSYSLLDVADPARPASWRAYRCAPGPTPTRRGSAAISWPSTSSGTAEGVTVRPAWPFSTWATRGVRGRSPIIEWGGSRRAGRGSTASRWTANAGSFTRAAAPTGFREISCSSSTSPTSRPREVGRWWVAGQHLAAGEKSARSGTGHRTHHPLRLGHVAMLPHATSTTSGAAAASVSQSPWRTICWCQYRLPGARVHAHAELRRTSCRRGRAATAAAVPNGST